MCEITFLEEKKFNIFSHGVTNETHFAGYCPRQNYCYCINRVNNRWEISVCLLEINKLNANKIVDYIIQVYY